ncbi:hypothetical protein IPH92_05060 [Candidatus Kaiserbacteria bacterium]|nr:MAG: hypothetical protein IPH92_05060 [Candidatus Kaiserbacteria bacterium]
MRHIFSSFILLGVLTPIFFATAALPWGNYGWLGLATADMGPKSPTCPPGSTQEEYKVVNLNTGVPISGLTGIVDVYNKATGVKIYSTTSTSSILGPVCYNPFNHNVNVIVNGGSSYYDFDNYYNWETPASVPTTRRMQSTVWLTPTAGSPQKEYRHFSPIGGATSTSPIYTIDTTRIPNLLGANAFHSVFFAIAKYDEGTGLWPDVFTQKFPLSGGVGIKTIPRQTLPGDGYYEFYYYLYLNGQSSAVPGFTSLHQPTSGHSGHVESFAYDKTPPGVTSINHTPLSVSDTDTVEITGITEDLLAGVVEIILYLDGAVLKTCSWGTPGIGGVNSAQCVADAGTFAAGTTHEYYLVSTDAAGVVSTSVTKSFTVVGTPLPNIVVSSVSPINAFSVADAVPNVLFSGTVQNIGTTFVAEGGWADLEIDWDSDGGSMGTGGDTFDNNYSAFGGLKLGAFALLDQKVITHDVLNPPVGTHRYRFTADVANELTESDENDNHSAWRTFTVETPLNQCTGTTPTSAQACSATLPVGSVPYAVVDRCSDLTNPSMCMYECVSGYVKDAGGTCIVLNQCTGTTPTSAQACSATLPVGSVPYAVVDRCSDLTNPSMCMYECVSGYVKDAGGTCIVLNQCTGTTPTSAQACSATPPSGFAPYMVVDKCSDWASPSMCIYECLAGYIKDGGGVCQLTQCNDGIDNSDTEDVLIDMADAGCANINDDDESDFAPVLTAPSRVVDEGDPITLSWDTNNGNESLCTLVGPGIVGNPLSPSTGDPELGNYTVNIYGLSIYTLTCGAQSVKLKIELTPRGWDS